MTSVFDSTSIRDLYRKAGADNPEELESKGWPVPIERLQSLATELGRLPGVTGCQTDVEPDTGLSLQSYCKTGCGPEHDKEGLTVEVAISAVMPVAYLKWLKTEYMDLGADRASNAQKRFIPMGVKYTGRLPPSARRIQDAAERLLAERGYEMLSRDALRSSCPGFWKDKSRSEMATVENLLFGTDLFR